MTRDDATMSLLEHLEELRSRIIVIAIAVLVAAIVGFFLADPIITALRAPLDESGAELIQTNVGEAFSVRLQLALMCGVAFAMPVILYEIWAFVTPGLTRPERRLVWPLLLVAVAPLRRRAWRSGTSSSRWPSASSSTSRWRAFSHCWASTTTSAS